MRLVGTGCRIVIVVIKTMNVFVKGRRLSSGKLDPSHGVTNGLVVATARLDHNQLLVRVHDGLVGPDDVHSRWILIQSTLDGALGNDGYAAVALEVIAGSR